jgi:hypothetical protein
VRDLFKSKKDGSIVEKWREAKLTNVKGDLIRIHFLGWDKRWDEDIDSVKDAHRLRPCKVHCYEASLRSKAMKNKGTEGSLFGNL